MKMTKNDERVFYYLGKQKYLLKGKSCIQVEDTI